jgi:hypothetical protein
MRALRSSFSTLSRRPRGPRHTGSRRRARRASIRGDVEGLVPAVPDLAHEEIAHGLHRAVGQGGTEDAVADQLEHLLPVPRERGGGDLGIVGVSVGVDAAAHPIGGLRDLLPVELFRAAHQHLLEQVGDARVVRRLRARAHPHHEGVGDHRSLGILAHEHGEPVGKERCG